MTVAVVLGAVGGTGISLDDPQLPGVLTRLAGGSSIEVLGSMDVKGRVKVTAFNQEAQEARCGDFGSWVDSESQIIFY